MVFSQKITTNYPLVGLNDASDVESYFNAFLNVEGEEKKNRFVTGQGFPKHPGREI